MQNQTRTTSFSIANCSAIMLISSELGFGFWKRKSTMFVQAGFIIRFSPFGRVWKMFLWIPFTLQYRGIPLSSGEAEECHRRAQLLSCKPLYQPFLAGHIAETYQSFCTYILKAFLQCQAYVRLYTRPFFPLPPKHLRQLRIGGVWGHSRI